MCGHGGKEPRNSVLVTITLRDIYPQENNGKKEKTERKKDRKVTLILSGIELRLSGTYDLSVYKRITEEKNGLK